MYQNTTALIGEYDYTRWVCVVVAPDFLFCILFLPVFVKSNPSYMSKKITVAYGDGIGPEIMESALLILQEAKANLSFNFIEVGKKVYEQGYNSGLTNDAWQKIKETGIIFKAPITTPQGGGYKSLNVTLRKKLGLYANVRPVSSFFPFVATNFPKLDVVIIRENEEDLYAGIEHRHTLDSYQCLKLITKEGCEKIIRYAFEYAVINGRKKVSCFSKDNIMKLSDGLFHNTFQEIAKEYSQIQTDHHIIDIACAKLATHPEKFDVIVTLNLYGDIISDIVAEISGSVGLAGSANIGENFAMFEAIHGSAPDIASQNIANPTGLIQASVMMLNHLGQYAIANKIQNALYKTIEDGFHTTDIYNSSTSKQRVSTAEFTKFVIANLGKLPQKLNVANFQPAQKSIVKSYVAKTSNEIRLLIGCDVFINWQASNIASLLQKLSTLDSKNFVLKTISAKGLALWPSEAFLSQVSSDFLMLRFIGKGIVGESSTKIINPNLFVSNLNILQLLQELTEKNIDFVKIENLYSFNNIAYFSSGQGE